MVSCDTLILGSGCWSAGAALSGRGSLLVVDRGAVIGAEYFDTFRPTSGWKSELRSAEARELYRAMADRGGIDGERSDSYLLAPFLYKMLIPHHSKFRLWTETVSIRPDGNGFLVTLFDADGSEEIRAGRIIDTTPDCISNPDFGRANRKNAALAAAVIAPAAADLMREWRPADGTLRPGRTSDELFFTVPVGADDSWPESREKLLKAWNRRREIFFRSCKIASIAKQRQVEVREDDHCFAPNHHYFNAGRFANPLSAVDAGISFGRA